MMKTYGVIFEGKPGKILYDEEAKTVSIEGLPPEKAVELEVFFTMEHDFFIPQSDQVDDFKVEQRKPIENVLDFELALCSLCSNTGVWVDW